MNAQDVRPREKFCYRCGKRLTRWHWVYVDDRMLPACPDSRECAPDPRAKGSGKHRRNKP